MFSLLRTPFFRRTLHGELSNSEEIMPNRSQNNKYISTISRDVIFHTKKLWRATQRHKGFVYLKVYQFRSIGDLRFRSSDPWRTHGDLRLLTLGQRFYCIARRGLTMSMLRIKCSDCCLSQDVRKSVRGRFPLKNKFYNHK